jgi:hypothetical protein
MHHDNIVKPLIYAYSDSDLKENSVLFIIAPDIKFSRDDINVIKNYVSSGNILIIADNFNEGNDLLNGMNVSNRFSKKPLYDITSPVVLWDEGYVLLKNPTTIEGNGTTVLMSSASSSIGEYPEPGHETSYPLMMELEYNNGKIILISDPTLFSNELFDTNEKFLKTYFNYSNKNIYFDEFHHSDVNPQNIATIVVRNNNISPESLSYLSMILLIIAMMFESSNIIYIKLHNYLRRVNINDELNLKIPEDLINKYNMDKTVIYKILSKLKN